MNGYVDNSQPGQSSLPVYHVAKTLGIPSHFVEIRHTATHESLPSLETLRDVSRQAVQWLWGNYWSDLQRPEPYKPQTQKENKGTSLKNSASSRSGIQNKIKENFKNWRRYRRNDPDEVIDENSSSFEAINQIVDILKSFISSNEEDVFSVLLEKNILIPKYGRHDVHLACIKDNISNNFFFLGMEYLFIEWPFYMVLY